MTQYLFGSNTERDEDLVGDLRFNRGTKLSRPPRYRGKIVWFGPLLRRCVWLGMLLTACGMAVVALLHLPGAYQHGREGGLSVLPLGSGTLPLRRLLDEVVESRWTSYLQGLLLGGGVVLLLMTRNLLHGTREQYWLAWLLAIGGLANVLLLLIPAALVLVNSLFWLIALCLITLLLALERWLLDRLGLER